jgi:predicted esterase
MIARHVLLWFLMVLTASCGGGGTSRSAVSAPPGPTPAADASPRSVVDSGVAVPEDAAAGEDGANEAAGATVSPDVDAMAEATVALDAGAPDAAPSDEEAWCPDGVETLPGPICAVVPDSVGEEQAPTLVIFLHGITNVGSGWQLALIQGMALYAKHQKFALLAPRAPRQPPAKGKADMYAWRTSTLSPGGEDAMLDNWMAAKATLEGRTGHPFKQVFVMGFSSGAYYVSSLALRGRLPVDGYAAFAGGSAPYSRGMISKVKPRLPIFVGYGLRDRAGSRDARGLVAALRAARWKHRVMAARRAGHTITTKQFTSALAYLRSESAAGAAPSQRAPGAPTSAPTTPPQGDSPAPPSKTRHRGSKHRVRPRRTSGQ